MNIGLLLSHTYIQVLILFRANLHIEFEERQKLLYKLLKSFVIVAAIICTI